MSPFRALATIARVALVHAYRLDGGRGVAVGVAKRQIQYAISCTVSLDSRANSPDIGVDGIGAGVAQAVDESQSPSRPEVDV